jgi:hypothetical protein
MSFPAATSISSSGNGTSSTLTITLVGANLPIATISNSPMYGIDSLTISGAYFKTFTPEPPAGATYTYTCTTSTQATIVVSGLSSGTTYAYSIILQNPTYRTIQILEPPRPVTISTAVAGNAQASVAFTTPYVGTDKLPITYTVRSNTGGFTVTGSSSPIIVTGLTNGAAYTFTVQASNAMGLSAVSSSSNSVTPSLAAAVPTIGTATIGNGAASVAFTAPSSNRFPITSYTVTASPGGFTGTGTSSPIRVTGLTNGTAYTFNVTATYASGFISNASTASAAVTPSANFPTIPAISTITSGVSGQLSVAFAAPSLGGRSAIANYQYSTDDGANWVTRSPVSAASPFVITTTSLTPFPALVNGTTYPVRIRAVNNNGDIGLATLPTNATPYTAPANITAYAGNTEASVAFSAPTTSTGSPITGYTVTSVTPNTSFTASGTSSPIIVTGLTNGIAYTFNVTATNASGTSFASAASNSVTPKVNLPTIPTITSIASGTNGQLTVFFDAPSSNGGSAITRYEFSRDGGVNWGTTTPALPTSSFNITGLTNKTAYQVQLRAVNANGSSYPTLSTIATPYSALISAISSVSQAANIVFSPPTVTNGSAITSYTVTSVTPNTSFTATGATSPITVTGLTNGTTYTFNVKATTADGKEFLYGGNSAGVAPVAALTGRQPPPTNVSAAVSGPGAVIVSWVPPTPNGTTAITGYTVTSTPDNISTTVSSSATSAIINGLNNAKTYTFTVRTNNGAGSSIFSSPSNTITFPFPDIVVSDTVINEITYPNIFVSSFATDSGNQAKVLIKGKNLHYMTGANFNIRDGYSGGAPINEEGGTADGGWAFCSFYDVSYNSVTGDSSIQAVIDNLPKANYASYWFGFSSAGGGTQQKQFVNLLTTSVSTAPGPPAVGTATVNNTGGITLSWTPSFRKGNGVNGATSYIVQATSVPGGVNSTATISINDAFTSATIPPITRTINYTTTAPAFSPALTLGTTYRIAVRAINGTGSSAFSAPSNTVIPRTVPGIPAIGSITSTTSSLSVPVTTASNGTIIRRYEYTTNANDWKIADVSSSPIVITTTSVSPFPALSSGTTYSVQLRAVNDAGTSSLSTSVNGTTKPVAPTITSITSPTITSLRINFTPPSGTVTNYKYSLNGGAWTLRSGTVNPIDITTGLSAGTAYSSVRILAVNAGGDGTESASVATATLASAPTGISIAPGNAKLTVAFTAPNPSATITNYEYSTNGGTNWIARNPVSVTSPLVITTQSVSPFSALVNGTAYSVQLRAVNAGGSGTATGSTSGTPNTVVPTPPTDVSGIPMNGAVSVSWNAPADNGGLAISSYRVTASPGGAFATTPNGTTTTATVTGLTNGTSYTFTVIATNSKGNSSNSTASVAIVPRTVPGAPASVSATSQDRAVVLAWTAPASNGGNAVSSYVIKQGTEIVATTAGALTATISGLTNGQSYTYTVAAINAAGEGTPATVTVIAGAPTLSVVNVSSTSVGLSWTTPTTGTINSYTLVRNGVDVTPSITGTTTTVSGLTANTAYTFAIKANYASGNSAVSATQSVTTLKFFSDVSNNIKGANFLSYTLSSSFALPSVGAFTITRDFVPVSNFSLTGSTLQITGLAEYTQYQFTIAATGFESITTVSRYTRDITAPGDISGFTGTPGNQQIVLNWLALGQDSGSDLKGYYIYEDSGVSYVRDISDRMVTSQTFTGLVNGVTKSYRIAAYDAEGNVGSQRSTNSITPCTVSAPPTNVTGVYGNGQVTVSWVAPANDGGSAITGYTVTASPGGATASVNGGLQTATVSGLTNGTPYTFTVTATNAAGQRVSVASAAITPSREPFAPTATARKGDSLINVAWNTPVTGGAPILGYQVGVLPLPTGTETIIDVSANAVVRTVSGLTNGTTYEARVRARNKNGFSEWSGTSQATPESSATTVNTVVSTITNFVNSAGAVDLTTFKEQINTIREEVVPTVATIENINASQLYNTVDEQLNLENKTVSVLLVASGETLVVPDNTVSDFLHVPGNPGDAFTLVFSGTPVPVVFDVDGILNINGIAYPLGSSVFLGSHEYRIVGVGSFGGELLTPLDAPTNVQVTGTTISSISLSWSPVDFATGYTVSLYSNVAKTLQVASSSTNETTLTINGLSAGRLYYGSVISTYSGNLLYGRSTTPAEFQTSTQGSGGAPCFFGNAQVKTPAGYRRMDSLVAGDLVLTPAGSPVAIEHVKKYAVAAGPTTNPYVIPAGQFGATKRVVISPDHKVCLADGRKVEAKKLGLAQEERDGVLIYYNLELTDQADMVVSGVAVESLAHIRRVVVTMDQFVAMAAHKYGAAAASPEVLAKLKRTCRRLADGRMEIPVARR